MFRRFMFWSLSLSAVLAMGTCIATERLPISIELYRGSIDRLGVDFVLGSMSIHYMTCDKECLLEQVVNCSSALDEFSEDLVGGRWPRFGFHWNARILVSGCFSGCSGDVNVYKLRAPMGIVIVLLSVIPLTALARGRLLGRIRTHYHHCQYCASNLSRTTSERCPECGRTSNARRLPPSSAA
jgi:hypothetical protein